MFPSYGASAFSSSSTILNALTKSPTSPSKSDRDVGKEHHNRSTGVAKALTRGKEQGASSPASQLSSSSAASQGPANCESDDTDMVFMRSTKQNESGLLRKTSDGIFNGSDIKDLLRVEKSELSDAHSNQSTLLNGSGSPNRHSRSSRESFGSTCSEGHQELGKLTSSSPLPKLFESLSPAERASMTRPQIVAQEILVTERIYVRDLQEVIEGYLFHLLHHGMTELDIETIFGNLEEIYDFNRGVLEDLENVAHHRNPVLISQCFLNKAQGFNSLYVQYCTNYPESAAFLSEILKDKEISDFFVERQKASCHTLPIDSYLMKPVQRIMKYHLLFKDMAKHYGSGEDGYDIIQKAASTMTDVAEYINEVKRLHENALRVQEILGSIEDLEGLDVFTTGRLVLENSFRVHGSRGDKQLYLFEKLLLICKKLDEGIYQFRDGLSCSNMMLVESIPKEPLCFQLIRFDNQKVSYTIQAKNAEIKREWTMQLKRLILETHTALIPTTAKEAILGRNQNARESKYSSINLQALDDSKIHWRRQKSAPHLGKENQNKDRSSLLVGVKRESILKEDSNNVPKRSSLNTKAKEFLDRQAKEKIKAWKMRRQKPRKSSGHSSFDVDVPDRNVMSPESEYVPPSTLVKSRSLESLRDSLSNSREDLLDVSAPEESEQSKEATDQIRRLSILHDLVSLDSQDDKDEMEAENLPLRTPSNSRDLRRRHASKSVYLEMGNDPIQPGDLKRTRPLSLPPGAQLDETGATVNGIDLDNDRERVCNDLRKYGLTRTRSFNRKHRSGARIFSGSTTSVTETSDIENHAPTCTDKEPDKFDMLERRLSIISDDDNSSNSIKNTLRQVSQAFSSHGSEQKIDSSRVPSVSTSSLTADIDAFLAEDEVWKASTLPRTKRRSLGSIISETINPAASSNLDRSKKRAFSTSVINEVSIGIKDDELEKRLSDLNDELENDVDFDHEVHNRVAPFSNAGEVGTQSNESPDIPFDRQLSNGGIEFSAPNRSSRLEIEVRDPQRSFVHREREEITQAKTGSRKPETDVCLQINVYDNDGLQSIPKRPAAPSSLNYVRSYAASIRRHRKRNVEISESKSVYDRIREYTALVSKEKIEQKSKTVDEMLESLDSANLQVSKKYMDNRRKFMHMGTSTDGEQQKTGSVLSAPHVWFNTKPQKEAADEIKARSLKAEQLNSVHHTPSQDAPTVAIEKPIKRAEHVGARPFCGISAVLHSWKSIETHSLDSLPRSKQKTSAEANSFVKPTAHLREDWRNPIIHTPDEIEIEHNNNSNTKISSKEDIVRTLDCNSGEKAEPTEKEEKPVPVKDLVKKYHQLVIIPGEKEVEEMMESKLRRSKKKKEREKMRNTLQRKLSLRNLNVEEEEEKARSKLSRSVSSENVTRGTEFIARKYSFDDDIRADYDDGGDEDYDGEW